MLHRGRLRRSRFPVTPAGRETQLPILVPVTAVYCPLTPVCCLLCCRISAVLRTLFAAVRCSPLLTIYLPSSHASPVLNLPANIHDRPSTTCLRGYAIHRSRHFPSVTVKHHCPYSPTELAESRRVICSIHYSELVSELFKTEQSMVPSPQTIVFRQQTIVLKTTDHSPQDHRP